MKGCDFLYTDVRDALLMLTDVEAVFRNWSVPDQTAIDHITPDALDAMAFAKGSMGTKKMPSPATSSGPEAKLRASAACRMRAPSSKDVRERRSD